MKAELGITGSIGLSHNKFLAKMASDMDKPQGFSVDRPGRNPRPPRPKPVGVIWGLGEAGQRALAEVGIRTIADLRRWDRDDLIRRFGSQGMRLYHLARGDDTRRVARDHKVKSISNETTFNEDIADADILDGHIWRLAEKLADRAKAKGLAGRTVTLKLKRTDFRTLTRRTTLPDGTQTADRIYRTARALYDRMEHPEPYRLIGVGLSDLMPEAEADREGTCSTLRPEDPPRRRGRHRQDPRPLRPRRDPQGSCPEVTRRPGSLHLSRNTPGVALGGRRRPHRLRPARRDRANAAEPLRLLGGQRHRARRRLDRARDDRGHDPPNVVEIAVRPDHPLVHVKRPVDLDLHRVPAACGPAIALRHVGPGKGCVAADHKPRLQERRFQRIDQIAPRRGAEPVAQNHLGTPPARAARRCRAPRAAWSGNRG
jgi:hypothetical protein